MIGDRRDQTRRDVNVPVELRWHDAAGADQHCAGKMRDVSRSGAQFQMARPIPLGATVELAAGEHQLSARVRFCVRAGSAFLIGVQFQTESDSALKS
jgi:hypothetical protein